MKSNILMYMVFRIFVLMLFASALYADVKVQDGRVSVDLQAQPLTQVLERLKSQTNMRMVVDEGISGKTVSASFQNLPVGLALKKILEGTGINYAVLAGADGQPQSVFIGGSSRTGVPPKRLDSRPTGNRGVVSPVAPPPPPPSPTGVQPDPRHETPQIKQQNPPLNIPTGGGFVPGQQPNPEEQPEQEQQQQEQLDDENSEN